VEQATEKIMRRPAGAPWAIVLAGGDGTRLQGMTVDDEGQPAPKQYCRITGDRSMLERALARAERLTSRGRIVPVVAGGHARWWLRALADYPAENCVVQPQNRGTAAAILGALLHIVRLDREPEVVILPADHAVEDEHVLGTALAFALDNVRRHPELAVLLGMPPDGPEEGYGWIEPLPGSSTRPATEPQPVAAFIEKPLPAIAAGLMQQGALWNSFLVAASGRCLLDLFRIAEPNLLRAFHLAGRSANDVARLYARLPMRDFCRHVLEQVPAYLRVLRVPACGWTDLGSPDRVRRFLAAHSQTAGGPGWAPPRPPTGPIAPRITGREPLDRPGASALHLVSP
jgi:mannose-1-phosphate guanylyltransferase